MTEAGTAREQPAPAGRNSILRIAIVGASLSAVVVYALVMGGRIASYHAPLADAAMEIEFNAAMGNLQLERAIRTGRDEDLDAVWEHLDVSEWNARAMLDGGVTPEGTVPALRDPALRREIEDVLAMIAEFREITEERLASQEEPPLGSPIMRRSSAVFDNMLNEADDVKTAVQGAMKLDLRRFRVVQGLLVMVFLMLSTVVGASTMRQVRRQADGAAALLESERRVRTLFEHAPYGILMCELMRDDGGDAADVTHLHGNPAVAELLGLCPEDIPGTNASEMLSPDDTARLVEVCATVVSTGRTASCSQHFPVYDRTLDITACALSGDVFMLSLVDTTRYREAEEAIAARERLLDQMSEIARIGGWEMDLEAGGEATWTKGTYDIVGLKQGDPIPGADEHVSWYLPEYRDMITKKMADLVETGRPMQFEARLRTAGGEVKWCRALGEAVREGDRVVRLHGTFQDITESRLTRDALRESEFRFQTMFDESPIATSLATSPGAKYTDVNDAWCKLMGFSREEAIGRSVDELGILDPEARSALHETFLRNGYLRNAEATITTASGERKETLLSVEPVVVNGQNFLMNMNIDISERRRAAALVEKSETLLNKMGDIARIGGWEMDLENDGKATWTKGTYDIVGLRQGDPVPDAQEHLSWYLPEFRDMIQERMTAIIETGQPMEFEAMFRTVEGEVRWCRVLGEAAKEDGRVVRLQGTVQDITEHKRLADELRRHREHLELLVEARTAELQAANRELEDFAHSVSHDLKAPLRAITGFSEIIARRHRDSLNEEARRYFDHILEAGISMHRLIEDLLRYCRLGRQSLETVPIPLADVFAELHATFDDRAKALDGCLDISDDPPTVLGNATLLRQVFTNLVDNGLSYGRPGVAPRVEIRWRTEGDRVVVSVRDNGVGIPPEFHEKVFKIFQRLHGNDVRPGTGIGLALVMKAVGMLNGSVRLESTPGEGSTFHVNLPLEKRGA